MRRKVTREIFKKLKLYMSSASTRGEAYLKISQEYGISFGTIKNAASKAGITSSKHSLRYIQPPRRKKLSLQFASNMPIEVNHSRYPIS